MGSTGIRLKEINAIVERHLPLSTGAPLLADGEFGIEAESGKLKQGDGTTAWGDLPYFTGGGGGGGVSGSGTSGHVSQWTASDAIGDTDLEVLEGTVTTSDDSATTLLTIPIADDVVYLIEARIVAIRTGGTAGPPLKDGSVSVVYLGVRGEDGSAVEVGGGASATVLSAGDNGESGEFNIDGANVNVRVTGNADTDYIWHATVVVKKLAIA